jgi:hypothetical protein
MNKPTNTHGSGRLIKGLLLALLSFITVAGVALAQETFGRTYDWTIDLETEPVKGRLEFPGTKFNDLTRIKVFYHKGNKIDSTKRTHYEDLWYQEDQIIGCRREHGFGLKPGEHLVIRVKHKEGATSAEAHAAADAIIRLVIDSYANGNMTSAVYVPGDSFNEIVQGLGRLNFFPAQPPKPDEQVYTIMVLNLYSDAGNQQIMHYAGETSGN